jgi:hypothetical protein
MKSYEPLFLYLGIGQIVLSCCACLVMLGCLHISLCTRKKKDVYICTWSYKEGPQNAMRVVLLPPLSSVGTNLGTTDKPAFLN